jgi:hypothetical protein
MRKFWSLARFGASEPERPQLDSELERTRIRVMMMIIMISGMMPEIIMMMIIILNSTVAQLMATVS